MNNPSISFRIYKDSIFGDLFTDGWKMKLNASVDITELTFEIKKAIEEVVVKYEDAVSLEGGKN